MLAVALFAAAALQAGDPQRAFDFWIAEWSVQNRHLQADGSLRAYDPARDDWDLLLFWTTDGHGGFGKLRGTFCHGRGEFFSGRAPKLTRYSFSDALADTVRWDSATTGDGGVTWKTDWIMEFSRTHARADIDQDREERVRAGEGELVRITEPQRIR